MSSKTITIIVGILLLVGLGFYVATDSADAPAENEESIAVEEEGTEQRVRDNEEAMMDEAGTSSTDSEGEMNEGGFNDADDDGDTLPEGEEDEAAESGGTADDATTTEAEVTVETDTATGDTSDEAIRPVQIEVQGQNFEFSQDEIRVQQGQEVTVVFESTGGTHDFVIDEFDVASEVVSSGEQTRVTFTPDQTGEFAYYCSIGSHRDMGMEGTLIVE